VRTPAQAYAYMFFFPYMEDAYMVFVLYIVDVI